VWIARPAQPGGAYTGRTRRTTVPALGPALTIAREPGASWWAWAGMGLAGACGLSRIHSLSMRAVLARSSAVGSRRQGLFQGCFFFMPAV
jgi:hypothetical protein